jgi:hypothetical protein
LECRDTEYRAGLGEGVGDAFGRGVSDQEESRWLRGTPAEWANESLAITREYVYPLPESGEITDEYAARALPMIHQRLDKPGSDSLGF